MSETTQTECRRKAQISKTTRLLGPSNLLSRLTNYDPNSQQLIFQSVVLISFMRLRDQRKQLFVCDDAGQMTVFCNTGAVLTSFTSSSSAPVCLQLIWKQRHVSFMSERRQHVESETPEMWQTCVMKMLHSRKMKNNQVSINKGPQYYRKLSCCHTSTSEVIKHTAAKRALMSNTNLHLMLKRKKKHLINSNVHADRSLRQSHQRMFHSQILKMNLKSQQMIKLELNCQ